MSCFVVQSVSKCFKPGTVREVWALRDVSLSIPQGSFTVLTGASGSGKTTLLGLLGALDRPTRGHVQFQSQDLGACSDVGLARLRRRMGFVFQTFALIPRLPVWENIAYPLIPRGIPRLRRYEIARSCLERCGIAHTITRRPEELSVGEQQRVAMARALAGQPDVVLADEPTSNLDPRSAGVLLALLKELHSEGRTVIVASHDRSLVSCATVVIELEMGRVKLEAPNRPMEMNRFASL